MPEIEFDYELWLKRMKERFVVVEHCNLGSYFISHDEKVFEIQTPGACLLVLPSLKYSLNCGFALKLIGKDGAELSGDTNIEIIKRKTNNQYIPIDDLLYYNIRYGHPTRYHTVKPLELYSMERLQFIINTPVELDFELSRLDAVMDLFEPRSAPSEPKSAPPEKYGVSTFWR